MNDLSELFVGFRRFQLVYVALRLGLPRLLVSGPKPLREIAADTGLPEQRLLRILRGLVWAEVLIEREEGGFSLAPRFEGLANETPPSVAGDILFHGAFFYSAWGHLEDYVRDGAIPFERAHGLSLFDRLAADPLLAREFNRPMAARTLEYVDQVAALTLFNDAESIVDIGSGEGELLLGIVKRRPGCSGVVFDLEVQRAAATAAIQAAALAERCRFEAGDMFSAVPKGGSVYLLKWVLHDWDDESVSRILKVLRRDIPGNARLMIIERLMPESIAASMPLAQADLNMLVLNGGAERSLPDYRHLLGNAGFILRSVEKIDTRYGFHALIAEIERSQ